MPSTSRDGQRLDKRVLPSLLLLVILLVLWQAVVYFKFINPIFVGSPLGVVKEFIDLFASKEIYPQLWNSFSAFFVGFITAVISGTVLGLVVGTNKKIFQVLSPYIYAIDALPKLVLFPLIIIWFGIGLNAKIFVIFLMTIIPVLVNTIDAAKAVDPKLVVMAHSFRGSRFFILKNIYLPASLPYIFSALRLAVGRALGGLILAEFNGIGQGIGYLIAFYGGTLQTDRLLALVLVVLIIDLLLLKSISFAEKKIIVWK